MATANNNFGSFQTALTTGGTAQLVMTGFTGEINTLVIKAMAGNTGKIYLGTSGVSATTGLELSAGDSLSLDAINLSALYFNGGTTADRIAVFWAGP